MTSTNIKRGSQKKHKTTSKRFLEAHWKSCPYRVKQ